MPSCQSPVWINRISALPPSASLTRHGECRTGRRQLRGPRSACPFALRASGSSLLSLFAQAAHRPFRSSRKRLIAALALRASGSSLLSLFAQAAHRPLAWSNERAHPVADAAREVGLPGRGGGPRAVAGAARQSRGQP